MCESAGINDCTVSNIYMVHRMYNNEWHTARRLPKALLSVTTHPFPINCLTEKRLHYSSPLKESIFLFKLNTNVPHATHSV